MDTEEHLDNLTRHIDLVREACLLLGNRLIKQGDEVVGRELIARGYRHDNSKFTGIEWDYLHQGVKVDPKFLELAIIEHQSSNDHHPEFWGGINEMPDVALAEMVCDWLARSQEFGSSLKDWIEDEALEKYSFTKKSNVYRTIKKFVDILLENSFVKNKGK